MSFALNAEIAAGLEVLSREIGEISPMAVGDVASRRAVYDDLQLVIYGKLEDPSDVTMTDYETTTADGATLLLRWYAKVASSPGLGLTASPSLGNGPRWRGTLAE